MRANCDLAKERAFWFLSRIKDSDVRNRPDKKSCLTISVMFGNVQKGKNMHYTVTLNPPVPYSMQVWANIRRNEQLN